MLSSANSSRITIGRLKTRDSNIYASRFNFSKATIRYNFFFSKRVNEYSTRYSAAITLVSGDITDADLCRIYIEI